MDLDFIHQQMNEQFIEKASQENKGCAGERAKREEGGYQIEEQG